MSKTYHVATDEESLTRLKERIEAEVGMAYERIGLLEEERDEEMEGALLELKSGSLREQLDKMEKFVSHYEYNDENKNLKPEIKGHIQKARSMTGSIKEMSADARFLC